MLWLPPEQTSKCPQGRKRGFTRKKASRLENLEGVSALAGRRILCLGEASLAKGGTGFSLFRTAEKQRAEGGKECAKENLNCPEKSNTP